MKHLLTVVFLALVACISATADGMLDLSKPLTFDAPIPAVVLSQFSCVGGTQVFSTQQDMPVDISDVLSHLTKEGDLTLDVKQSYLTPSADSVQTFQSLKHAKLTMAGEALAETNFTLVDGKAQLPVLMSSAELVKLLAAGPQTIHLLLQTCVPGVVGNVSVEYSFELKANFSFNKGV